MKKKAKRELDEWEERSRQAYDGGGHGPRMAMFVLMKSRASFSYGKVVGIDGISVESIAEDQKG